MNLMFWISVLLNIIYVLIALYIVYKYIYSNLIRDIFLYDFKTDKIKTFVDYVSNRASWIKKVPSFYVEFLDKYFVSFYNLSVEDFVRFQLQLLCILFQLFLVIGLLFKCIPILSFIMSVVLCISLMDLYIIRQYDRRSVSFSSNLIEFIDTVSLCLSSGMDIISSFNEASHQKDSILHREFLNFIKRVQLGVSIEESFSMINTKSSDELSYFITTISYAIETGSDLSETICKISEDIKSERIQGLESKAGEISVKMLFPMLLCIFPSVVSLLISPMIIDWFLNG